MCVYKMQSAFSSDKCDRKDSQGGGTGALMGGVVRVGPAEKDLEEGSSVWFCEEKDGQ